MQTPTPTFDTICISQIYPTIKGNCTVGSIDVYDEKFNLIKSITVSGSKFFINLDEVEFKAILIKNTGTGYTTSEFSKILISCYEPLPCVKRVNIKTCEDSIKPKCVCQIAQS